jgi:acetolactate synthase-1/3 small subunit
MEHLHTLSLLAKDNPGVISRISGLFSRRGFNISSLTASRTRVEGISRITLVVAGDDWTLEQIVKQLAKLEDIEKVIEMKASSSIQRELALIKVAVAPSERGTVLETADIFRAKIVDVSKQTVTVEITGGQDKIEAFIDLMEPFEIREIVRTGITALGRGPEGLDSITED